MLSGWTYTIQMLEARKAASFGARASLLPQRQRSVPLAEKQHTQIASMRQISLAAKGFEYEKSKVGEDREVTDLRKEFKDEFRSSVFSVLGSITLMAIYVAYVVGIAPNGTPASDALSLKAALGLEQPEDALFVLRYVPLVSHLILLRLLNFINLVQLMIPSQRDPEETPTWPFVFACLGGGILPIVFYFSVCSSKPYPQILPPPRAELKGFRNLLTRMCETNVLPAVTAAAAGYLLLLVGSDLLADLPPLDKTVTNYNGETLPVSTSQFELMGKLMLSSRLVNLLVVDMALQVISVPLYLNPDCKLRRWKPRKQVVPFLYFLPVLGPAIYLLRRPKTYSWPFKPSIPEPLPARIAQDE